MPKWLRLVIEAAVTLLKAKGQIDPNVQRAPKVPFDSPGGRGDTK